MAPGVAHDAAWWAGFCEVMELTRSGCGHCRGLKDAPEQIDPYDTDGAYGRVSVQRDGLAFAARYAGTCAECRHSIEVGDQIRQRGTSYVHEGCGL